MKSGIAITLIALSIMVSCGEKKQNAKDNLYDKVMAVHDEIMPKMGDMMKYKKQLNEKIDMLLADSSDANTEKISALKQAVAELDNSHEEMMGWMHQFDNDFEGMVEQEVMDYLNDQMKKIENVGLITNTALKNAEQALAK